MTPRTMFDRIWHAHEVVPETADTPAVLYVDLHLVHEVTSPQAFALLAARGLRVRRPDRTLATLDHSTPTATAELYGHVPMRDAAAASQIAALQRHAAATGIELLDIGDRRRGIVHVIGPELGATWPGSVVVCGDSHTSTHGAFGALAFGIGTTEVGHVLATQCLLQRKPRTLAVEVTGTLAPGVGAKDLVLAIIARLGVAGGTGHVLEYRGAAIRALSMDERMTVCNMSIEAGARAGLIAPDDTTIEYLRGRPRAPAAADWERAVAAWRALPTDSGAVFDHTETLDAGRIEPMITFGTNPAMGCAIGATIPARDDPSYRKALAYMGFAPGERLAGRRVDLVFIGSCTNSRLSDLRAAAAVLRGRRVAAGVRVLVVPGSEQVRTAAEAEGLAAAFVAAGAEWREAGCSMCLGMNGDIAAPGQYVVSTSNRNFEGRQGPGVRTLLASPATAAAAAATGCITDPREFAHRGD
ncbi:MAG: 3-isopropylmalate dehydratase large subunit [Gammaproteobacteria bacterium]|nr:3-isopropylmalate dehydratase large subunit [Gammaproteobacteria bacterium]